MAVAAPSVPPAASAQAGRMARHPWLSVLWTAARTPRGTAGLALASAIVLIAAIGPFVSSKPPDALLTLPFAKPCGQFPLGAQPVAGAQRTGGDQVQQPDPGLLGRRRLGPVLVRPVLVRTLGGVLGHPMASSDSGMIWPPSTTRVCPVM